MHTEIMNIVLLLLGLLGSLAAFVFIQRLFSPAKEVINPLTSAEDLEQKESSVFNKINPNGTFLDRLDLFLARTCGQDKKLEEAYMLLGRPKETDPLQMLHKK